MLAPAGVVGEVEDVLPRGRAGGRGRPDISCLPWLPTRGAATGAPRLRPCARILPGGEAPPPKTRLKLPAKMAAWLSASRSSSSSAARWASSTACCQPRGKNEESDPNSIRSDPSTASAWRNTSTRRRPGVYFVQAFELDVSTWRLGQRSAAMRVCVPNSQFSR